jgi:hypothetical protein
MATGVQQWYSQKKGKEKLVTQGAGTLKDVLMCGYLENGLEGFQQIRRGSFLILLTLRHR